MWVNAEGRAMSVRYQVTVEAIPPGGHPDFDEGALAASMPIRWASNAA